METNERQRERAAKFYLKIVNGDVLDWIEGSIEDSTFNVDQDVKELASEYAEVQAEEREAILEYLARVVNSTLVVGLSGREALEVVMVGIREGKH